MSFPMFFQNRLIYKMPDQREVLSGLGTKLPHASEGRFVQVSKSARGFEKIKGPKEMVVFAPEGNP